MAWDPINETELTPGYPVLKHMRQAWNSIMWLFGQIGTLATGAVQNGSFEINSDGNQIPDGWTWTASPGGSIALDMTTPAHGATAVKITHPGGSGNGGGTLKSDYITCSELIPLYLGWIHWASAAGMKNRVSIEYYTKAKAAISTALLYESTINPTDPTYIFGGFTPVSGARYYKIIIEGGATDTNVAGSAYFDHLHPAEFAEYIRWQSVPCGTISEVSRSTASWADVGSVSLFLPRTGNLPKLIYTALDIAYVPGYSLPEGATPGSVRLRIGSSYSAEIGLSNDTYISTGTTVTTSESSTGVVTLYIQIKSGDAGMDGPVPVRARKPATSYSAVTPVTNF